MLRKRYLTVVLMVLFGVLLGMAGEVRLKVIPGTGKRSIETGDLFYITIEVVNLDGSPSKPSSVPGATVNYFARTGSSMRTTIINGHGTTEQSYTWTMTLRAKSEGSYSFGPVTVGGVKSNVVKYNIGKPMPAQDPVTHRPDNRGAAQSAEDDDKPRYIGHGDQNLFLRANVTKTSAYEQEALVYTVKLYTNYDAVKFIGATAAPKFNGFVIEESKDISQQLSYETYDGKTYATAIIARYIIFPQMTGKLKVSGNTYTISVDRREYFHDPFFGGMAYSQPLQLNVTPNDLVIDVKPLPQPRPNDFSGGVGRFQITSQLKGTEFRTNQTASIVYTVTGTGNLKYIQMADLAALYPPQLEIYTPTTTQNVNVGANNTSGNVTFDYSFMPTEEGTFSIPEVNLVYFNPETGQYEKSTAKGYSITVGKGQGSSKSQARKRQRFDPELQKVNIDRLHRKHDPIVYKGYYWLWFIIPTVLLLGSVAGWWRYNSLHKDMTALNMRRANKIARRRLRRAAAAMKKKNRDLFYDELLTALWGYLGDKLKMPTSELLRDNIRQNLDAEGIPANVTDRLINLVDEAEFAKYSSAGGDQSMEGDYREAIASINELEDAFRNASHD